MQDPCAIYRLNAPSLTICLFPSCRHLGNEQWQQLRPKDDIIALDCGATPAVVRPSA